MHLPYKTLVVDDEPRVVRHITGLLEADPDMEIALSTTNPLEAQAFEAENRLDLAIVDIEMEGLGGLELVRQFSGEVYVIICTSHSDQGDESTDTGASEFLAKPFEESRFYRAIDRFKTRRNEREQRVGLHPGPHYLNVPLLDGPGAERIALDTVVCFYSLDKQVFIAYVDGSTRLVDKTLHQLERQLRRQGFLRIHKGYIANMKHAVIFHRKAKPTLEFSDAVNLQLHGNLPNQLPVGRSYRLLIEHFFF